MKWKFIVSLEQNFLKHCAPSVVKENSFTFFLNKTLNYISLVKIKSTNIWNVKSNDIYYVNSLMYT